MAHTLPHRPDILHMTSAHSLLDTRIYVKEVCSLANAGYQVAIIGPEHERKISHEELRELGDRIDIILLPHPKTRLARFFSLGWRLYRTALKLNAGTIHIHDPDLLIIGLLLHWQGRLVIYDVHEDYSKSMLSRTWLQSAILQKVASIGVRWVENRVASRFAGFILADHQLSKPFPLDRTVIVRNYLQLKEWPASPAAMSKSTDIRCVYVGDISYARGLIAMCDLIDQARKRGMSVTLELVGNIPTDLRNWLNMHPAAKYITLKGRKNRKEVSEILWDSDIAFSLFKPTPAYLDALPVKILEYLIAGLPIITTDTPRLRAEKRLGPGLHFCAPENTSAAIDALEMIVNNRQEARAGALQARNAVIEEYLWRSEEEILVGFYHHLIGPAAEKITPAT